jgi:signal transduction histidine kinase
MATRALNPSPAETPSADRAGTASSGPSHGPFTSELDLALFVLAVVAVLVEALLRAGADETPVAYLLVLLPCAPLAVRRRWPLPALITSAIFAVLCAAVLHASWTVTAVVAVLLYTVALRGDRRRSLLIGLATALLVTVTVLLIDEVVDTGAIASRIALVFLCVAAGDVVRSRQELATARRERHAQEERERTEQLKKRATDERLQIARELHDTLAHSLVAINVRAGVAIDVSQDQTAALEDIKQVSYAALHDLRSTLSALRESETDAPTAPAPALTDLHDLIDNARATGLDADLRVELGQRTLPAAFTAATVRIVQESLTNVIRHAGASRARVAITTQRNTLLIDITDDGTTQTPPITAAHRQGFGIRGMSERASALGGQLIAGPSGDGGWSVNARLPLDGHDT